MADAIQVKVEGLAELGQALKDFGPVLSKKYLRKATFEMARVIADDAKSRVAVRTGTLRDNIAVFKRLSTDVVSSYVVGVRKIKLNRKMKKVLRILRNSNGGARTSITGDAYYWRFLEFGTAKMSAHPFMRTAFEAQKMNALSQFQVALAAGVEAASREVARSTK